MSLSLVFPTSSGEGNQRHAVGQDLMLTLTSRRDVERHRNNQGESGERGRRVAHVDERERSYVSANIERALSGAVDRRGHAIRASHGSGARCAVHGGGEER